MWSFKSETPGPPPAARSFKLTKICPKVAKNHVNSCKLLARFCFAQRTPIGSFSPPPSHQRSTGLLYTCPLRQPTGERNNTTKACIYTEQVQCKKNFFTPAKLIFVSKNGRKIFSSTDPNPNALPLDTTRCVLSNGCSFGLGFVGEKIEKKSSTLKPETTTIGYHSMRSIQWSWFRVGVCWGKEVGPFGRREFHFFPFFFRQKFSANALN